jgi:hypothetical protein
VPKLVTYFGENCNQWRQVNAVSEAMRSITDKWVQYLGAANAVDRRDPYLKEPYPTALDVAIEDVVASFRAMTEAARRAWLANLRFTQRDSQIWLTFSIRMATQALRELTPDRIAVGATAHLIEGERDDWRENVIVLTLLFDAAKKLGADPIKLFATTASLVPEGGEASNTLRDFRNRKPDVLTIGSMGYTTTMTAQGIRYEPIPAL